jgi:hypothetical protein
MTRHPLLKPRLSTPATHNQDFTIYFSPVLITFWAVDSVRISVVYRAPLKLTQSHPNDVRIRPPRPGERPRDAYPPACRPTATPATAACASPSNHQPHRSRPGTVLGGLRDQSLARHSHPTANATQTIPEKSQTKTESETGQVMLTIRGSERISRFLIPYLLHSAPAGKQAVASTLLGPLALKLR